MRVKKIILVVVVITAFVALGVVRERMFPTPLCPPCPDIPPAGLIMRVATEGKQAEVPILVERIHSWEEGKVIDFYYLNGIFYGDAVPTLGVFDMHEPDERAVLLQDRGMKLIQPNGSPFFSVSEWHSDDEHFPGPDFPAWVRVACRTSWGPGSKDFYPHGYLFTEEGVYVIDREELLRLIPQITEPGIVEIPATFYREVK